jgi:protein-S-isoprenylcysteine O-methyltransferase Ste14
MATGTSRSRPDVGRVIVVPAAAIMLVLAMMAVARRGGGPMRVPDAVLTGAYYLLIIWCYLRRGPAVATTGSVTGRLAAVAGTLFPFMIPLARGAAAGTGREYAATVLVLAGTVWELWALRSLGRSMSIIAQARTVVDRGPYRWVRHPLYAGEIGSALGLAVSAGSAWGYAAWLAFCAVQAYRAVCEEEVLLRALPAYRSYRARTAALLPGVF